MTLLPREYVIDVIIEHLSGLVVGSGLSERFPLLPRSTSHLTAQIIIGGVKFAVLVSEIRSGIDQPVRLN